MTKLKKFSICLVSGMLLLGTVAFARTGTVKAPTGLVLRETASKTANPITTVSNNETVEILEDSNDLKRVFTDYQSKLEYTKEVSFYDTIKAINLIINILESELVGV